MYQPTLKKEKKKLFSWILTRKLVYKLNNLKTELFYTHAITHKLTHMLCYGSMVALTFSEEKK
jgi:hypothetical protein